MSSLPFQVPAPSKLSSTLPSPSSWIPQQWISSSHQHLQTSNSNHWVSTSSPDWLCPEQPIPSSYQQLQTPNPKYWICAKPIPSPEQRVPSSSSDGVCVWPVPGSQCWLPVQWPSARGLLQPGRCPQTYTSTLQLRPGQVETRPQTDITPSEFSSVLFIINIFIFGQC